MLVSPRTAFWIGDILSDADARAYIFGRGSSLELPFAVAVKTGTSQAYHDNWTIGFTRRVTVGVWVGNFDRRPLRNSSGVTGAAPIFQAVMLAAHRRAGGAEAALARPDAGLERRDVCGLSGEAANAWCPVRRREWLPIEHQSLPCSWHLSAVASAKVDHLADEGLLTVWPAEFREWAGRRAETMARPAAGPSREPASSACRDAPRRPPRVNARAAGLPPGQPADRRDLSDRSDAAPRVPDPAAAGRVRLAHAGRVERQRFAPRRGQLGVGVGVAVEAGTPFHRRA